MPIHFRGFCSLDLAKWTFNLSKEPYSYEGLKFAPTLRTIVYFKICKGLVSLDLPCMTFLVCLLLLDYGPIMGLFNLNLNFSQKPYFFSWEMEARMEVLETSGMIFSTKSLKERKKRLWPD